MRATTKLSSTLLLAFTLAACSSGGGSDISTGPDSGTDNPAAGTLAGTFLLATHNGDALPAHAWHDEAAEGLVADMYVLSGSILLRSDSTYRQTATARLVIQGVTDQTHTSATDGTFSFAPSGPGAIDGTLTFHSNGRQQTCPLTQISITCETTMPGPVGQADVPVVLVWVRE